jgi:hypothetical protein
LAYEISSGENLGNGLIRLRFEPLESASPSSTDALLPKKPPSPKFLEWKDLDEASSGTVSGNTLVWDPDSVSILAKLSPSQEGVFEFSVPVIGPAAASTGTTGFQAVVEASVEMVGKSKLNRTVRTKPMVFRFRSDVALSSQARYFSEEGAPQGSGPLPPVVGQPTTYRLTWDVSKTLHELRNLRLTAVLPKNVAWSDGAELSAGEISFSEATREIRWQLNKLPADVDSAYAYFDLTLTPSNLDDGRFAELLGETRFEAMDGDINEPIILTKPALTTDLRNDEGAKGKGVVRKP